MEFYNLVQRFLLATTILMGVSGIFVFFTPIIIGMKFGLKKFKKSTILYLLFFVNCLISLYGLTTCGHGNCRIITLIIWSASCLFAVGLICLSIIIYIKSKPKD
jgi:hypothetical protein